MIVSSASLSAVASGDGGSAILESGSKAANIFFIDYVRINASRDKVGCKSCQVAESGKWVGLINWGEAIKYSSSQPPPPQVTSNK